MDRQKYLDEFDRAFSFLPEADREEMAADYREHFEEVLAAGRSEEEISRSLGDPRILARQYRAGYRIREAKENSSPGNIFRAILAALALGVFNFIFLFVPFIVALSLLLAALVAGSVMVLGGLAATILSVPLLGGYFGITGSVTGLAVGSLGLLIVLVTLLVTRAFGQLTVLYLHKNLELIRKS